MPDFYIIAGISGIGKTSVLNKVIDRNKKIKGKIFYEEMKDIVKKNFKLNDEEKIKKILDRDEIFTEVRSKAIKKILRSKDRKILLETNFAMFDKFFLPEISINDLSKFKLKKIFLIEAKPSEIKKLWASKGFAINIDIEYYLGRERSYAEFVSKNLKVPLKIIKSTDLDKIAEEILKEIK